MATSIPLVSAFVVILIILPQMAALVISPVLGATGYMEWEPDNTARADPLNNLKRYRGGFNVTNRHYWSSVIFTGACGYAIGLLCLVCGLLYASFLGTTKFCCKTNARRKMKSRDACNDKSCDMWFILMAILLTILAMAATGIVLGGSAKFYSEARASVNIIIKTANEASQTLHNTTGALKDIESKLGGSSVGVEASHILTSTSHKLDAESALIEMQATRNRHRIHRGLNILFMTTTVTISFNSVAAAALSVCGFLKLRRTLYFLIVLCWLMTAICWILFGVYIFLDRFSKDACRALARFEENPYNNSLSSILPCDQLVSAKTVLSRVSAGIYNLVNEVNANISALQRSSVHVCNPFSAPPLYSYQPHNCPANTVRIADVPKVLSMFVCPDSEGTCDAGVYETVEAYTSAIQDLLDVYPRMQNLVECQSLKQAFSHILLQHCKPLESFARMTWAGLVFLAVLMLFLLLLCFMNPQFPSKTAASATSSTHSP